MTRQEPQSTAPPLPLSTAEELREALQVFDISADVHDGFGLALVSVWVGLVVWCDGELYWWRTAWDGHRKRSVYAWHPAVDTARAARRVALRYADLRDNHPLSEVINGLASSTAAPGEGTG